MHDVGPKGRRASIGATSADAPRLAGEDPKKGAVQDSGAGCEAFALLPGRWT